MHIRKEADGTHTVNISQDNLEDILSAMTFCGCNTVELQAEHDRIVAMLLPHHSDRDYAIYEYGRMKSHHEDNLKIPVPEVAF